MRFVCDNCQAKYSIADERVENKVVKLSCQKCGAEITVRGPVTKPAQPEAKKAGPATMAGIEPIGRSKPAVEEAFFGGEDDEPKESTRIASLSELERMRQEALADATNPIQLKKAAPAPAPPPPQAPEWMLLLGSEQKGPFALSAIKDKIASAEVTARTYVWRSGLPEWVRLSSVAELAALLPKETAKPTLAVADLVDKRIQTTEVTKKRTIEPSAKLDDDEPPAPFSTEPEPQRQAPAQPQARRSEPPPQTENTRAVINASGLVEQQRKKRLYLMAALGCVGLAVLTIVLDLTGVITIPGLGAAYNMVGIDDPHKTPGAPQYSDNLTEEERRKIREGLMGKPKTETEPTTQVAPASATTEPGEARAKVPSVKAKSEELPDGIDAASVNKVVAANQASVKTCLDQSLKRNPDLTGRLEVSITIAESGAVSAVDIKSSKHRGELGDCVTAAVKTWKFPRFAGDPIAVEVPFILSTGN